MVPNFGSMLSFLGKAAADHSKELAKATRDLAWHNKQLEIALREAARGHAREAIIQNHRQGAKAAAELIKKLSK